MGATWCRVGRRATDEVLHLRTCPQSGGRAGYRDRPTALPDHDPKINRPRAPFPVGLWSGQNKIKRLPELSSERALRVWRAALIVMESADTVRRAAHRAAALIVAGRRFQMQEVRL